MPMYLPKTAASISDAADWLAIRDNQPISSSNEYQQPISSFRNDAKLTRSRKKTKTHPNAPLDPGARADRRRRELIQRKGINSRA